MRDGYLRGTVSTKPTARQVDVLTAYVAVGGSVPEAAERATELSPLVRLG